MCTLSEPGSVGPSADFLGSGTEHTVGAVGPSADFPGPGTEHTVGAVDHCAAKCSSRFSCEVSWSLSMLVTSLLAFGCRSFLSS